MKSSEYLLRIANAELEKKLASKIPSQEMIPARDHVLANLETIRRARSAGWSLKQIHAELEACGVSIEFNTFRKYVSDYAPVRKVSHGDDSHLPERMKLHVAASKASEDPPDETQKPAASFSSRFRSAGLT